MPAVEVATSSFVDSPARRRVADLLLKVNCGCMFTTRDLNEALRHAEKTGHTLHISGEVRVAK